MDGSLDLTGSALEPGWLWTPEGLTADRRLVIGADGRIEAVEPAGTGWTGTVHRWPRRALLPGFVNAHSHAFQRALRGRGERFPAGKGSFWSWREEMYRLVGALDRQGLHDHSVAAFREMRAAGVTTVGEFHYVHHEEPEALDFRFDEVIVAAAAEAGIRLVLLVAYYRTGGFDKPLEAGQQRFHTPSTDVYWRQMDHLEKHLATGAGRGLAALGAVAHSVRAVPAGEIGELSREAAARGLPLHLHVEEQRAEIEACLAATGKRPMELLLEVAHPEAALTAVHCTHTRAEDLDRFLEGGGRVCVCPLTEANLGDGLPGLEGAAGELCLGTDSNARISMIEEMRWLEYGQRLAGESRGRLIDPSGEVAPVLLDAATRGGAAALGLDTGVLEAGRPADLVAVDLDHPVLAGLGAEELLAGLVFGAGNEVIAGTAVGGHWEPVR